MTGRILVVDDQRANSEMLAGVLQARGYQVSTAASGEAALAAVQLAAPDLVVADIRMPGIDGYELCRRLREQPATTMLPVILITSTEAQDERVKGLEAGADDFLSRPVNWEELFARVRSLLRTKRLQDEIRALNAALEERVRRQVAELEQLGRLKRFFSPPVADAIVSAGENSILAPHRREICYVFADLRGFTAFTDSAEPEEVQTVLHDYHAAMGAIITAHGGTVDRFAGDGILIFFNDPLPTPEPMKHAAAMSLAMQEAFAPLRERWTKHGYELDLAIGIAKGFATLGAFGFEGRFDYSAIGSVVNLAARLCAEAQPGQILVDRRARAALDDEVVAEPTGPLTLKGYAQPVPAFVLRRK